MDFGNIACDLINCATLRFFIDSTFYKKLAKLE